MPITDAELSRIPLFKSLSVQSRPEDAQLRSQILERVRALRAPKGNLIVDEGDDARDVYVVDSGVAKIVLYGKSGREVILGFAVAGDMFGEMAVVDGGKRSASVVACVDSNFFVIPKQVFFAGLANSGVAETLVRHLVGSLRRTTDQLKSKFVYTSVRAVLDQLFRSSENVIEKSSGAVLFKPSRQINEIAQILGCERETVSRRLRQLAQERHISISRTKNRRIVSVTISHAMADEYELTPIIEELRSRRQVARA